MVDELWDSYCPHKLWVMWWDESYTRRVVKGQIVNENFGESTICILYNEQLNSNSIYKSFDLKTKSSSPNYKSIKSFNEKH